MGKKQESKKPVKVQPAQKMQGRRPTARSEKTRLQVLNAAALCITQQGFAAASTILIAQQAGVSWGVLQYHFGDKDGLMTAVLEYSMEQTENRLNNLITTGFTADTPVERLRALTREAWKIYSSPLARAATEIVINNRNKWQDDEEKDRFLLDLFFAPSTTRNWQIC
jgi:AcrR family transcriptional regulator